MKLSQKLISHRLIQKTTKTFVLYNAHFMDRRCLLKEQRVKWELGKNIDCQNFFWNILTGFYIFF